jgi:hypothetical protein
VRHLGLAILAALLVGCGPPETRFEATAEPRPGDRVAASGETALPDGAQLNVTLERPAGGDPLAVALPQVKGGRWAAELAPGEDLPAGAYVVRVVFSPRAFAWSPAVKPAVGENGEKLGGPAVKQGDGHRYLELLRPVTLP